VEFWWRAEVLQDRPADEDGGHDRSGGEFKAGVKIKTIDFWEMERGTFHIRGV